ncbi:uncharacterized protein LOC131952688 [Physella acuta]|uniref:uncharacterized protein LOC131952688 n=1 Tax=Physella acuta TaxID=109671 RepID=UPI0027DB569B|nr:uncharacterized protein LOC131952688 [Physella acuta]
MIKNRAVSLGCLSGFVIVGGIIFAVLLAFPYDSSLVEVSNSRDWDAYKYVTLFPFWIFGFVFIVPGILGCIAAFVQNKCMYVTALVFGILAIITMAIIIIVLGVGIQGVNTVVQLFHTKCQTSEDKCVCSDEGETIITIHKPCEYFEQFSRIYIAMFVMNIVTWIVLFAEFVLCCYYTCCARDHSIPYVTMQPDFHGISVTQVTQQSSQSGVNPTYMLPAYGAPQSGQAGYGAPQPGQAGYGAPQYGQAGYGAPQYSKA